ncbi:MAG: threonine--tRNA ligase [Waddliaceae bacterium]|jgi:threonyl-tRNA synthetase|nr:threonine--tRNA ligase [Waddliaceae bacterium]MBT7264322.1 threonine--tRNA ligase [Waddliaceae bacterium]
MLITLHDGSSVELPENSTAQDLAEHLKLTAPDKALAIIINDLPYDLNTPLSDGDTVRLLDFDDSQGKEIFWHTSAHVLAQAVVRLWPDAKPTIGPSIENGFYYDFANLTITDSDFKAIEKEMVKIINENPVPQREVICNKKEALKLFADNVYKRELIEDIDDAIELTGYRQGDFHDLCRGPHLPKIGKIKALKILKTSGAYWHGDSDNEMLTRIYGITFPDKKALKAYITMLEEAKKRDHKVLGPKLGLFSLHEEAPGMPIIHPKGLRVWDKLIGFMRELHDKSGYVEIKTPILMTKELWETSGHWFHYKENMYTTSIEKRDFAIKPMNCPGCMLYYKAALHSYREFPLRIAEFGNVHRNEASGAISGLLRVRSFHQDDAHVFLEYKDLEDEILNILDLADKIYTAFGLSYSLELSTRPEKNTIGTDEEWELSTQGLYNAIEKCGKEYQVNEGDGAFYGPKIDLHISDAIGRRWQCGTIQVDMSLPEKFDLTFTASDGSRKRPVLIHRALFGSIERFFGVIIEHFAGRFPLWLSPHHVRIVAVADRHVPYAKECADAIQAAGFICDVDDSHDSVSKKIRQAQLEQINYIMTIGDKEVENTTIALRTRNNIVVGEVPLCDFIENISKEKDERTLTSHYEEK